MAPTMSHLSTQVSTSTTLTMFTESERSKPIIGPLTCASATVWAKEERERLRRGLGGGELQINVQSPRPDRVSSMQFIAALDDDSDIHHFAFMDSEADNTAMPNADSAASGRTATVFEVVSFARVWIRRDPEGECSDSSLLLARVLGVKNRMDGAFASPSTEARTCLVYHPSQNAGVIPPHCRFKKIARDFAISYSLSDDASTFPAANHASSGFRMGRCNAGSKKVEWLDEMSDAAFYSYRNSGPDRSNPDPEDPTFIKFANRLANTPSRAQPPQPSDYYWDKLLSDRLKHSREHQMEVMDILSSPSICEQLVRDRITIEFDDREICVPLELADIRAGMRPLADMEINCYGRYLGVPECDNHDRCKDEERVSEEPPEDLVIEESEDEKAFAEAKKKYGDGEDSEEDVVDDEGDGEVDEHTAYQNKGTDGQTEKYPGLHVCEITFLEGGEGSIDFMPLLKCQGNELYVGPDLASDASDAYWLVCGTLTAPAERNGWEKILYNDEIPEPFVPPKCRHTNLDSLTDITAIKLEKGSKHLGFLASDDSSIFRGGYEVALPTKPSKAV